VGGGWIVDVDLRKFFDTIDHVIYGSSSSVGCAIV